MSSPDVAVIGMACIFPGAPDLRTFWENICNGVDAITDVPPARVPSLYYDPATPAVDRFYVKRGGFIDEYATFDASAFGIMPIAARGTEPDQLLALQTAASALADAGYAGRDFTRDRTSVILGRGNYLGAGMVRLANHVRAAEQILDVLRTLLPDLSQEQLEAVKRDFQARSGSYGPDSAIGLVPNLCASRVSNRLNLGGSSYTLDAACASALIAIDHGCRELTAGIADLAIVGGMHFCQDPAFWSVFTQLGAMSRGDQIRPFDRRADGLLIGEGIGLAVLKRLQDAEHDNDRIYAVIRGVGVASDGRDASLMTPLVDGQLHALQRAWQNAQLDPLSVGLVEAHGTATPAGDAAELETLTRFFGPAEAGKQRGGLGSVKSMIGHAMPAAGAAGFIKAVLALHHGVLPPTLHCEEPNPALEASRFRLIREAEPWENGQRRAAVNAFGFGGINAHVILDAHASAVPSRHGGRSADGGPAKVDLSKTLLVAANSQAELLAALDAGSERGTGTWRLAVFDPTPSRLETARRAVQAGVSRHGRDGIFFSPTGLIANGGKIAFLFPGVESVFDPQIDDVAAFTGTTMPELDSTDVDVRGAGVSLVSAIINDALNQIGVQPDVIAGHSVGEWTGMMASGMVDADAVRQLVEAATPGELQFPDLAYLAVGAGHERVEAATSALADVHISHDNCTHQTILCGPSGQIKEAMNRLRSKQILCELLSFKSGFHSSGLGDYVRKYLEHLDELPFEEPSIPLWSATTCLPYPSGRSAVRELFRDHLLHPVRFRELILALYEHGVRVFVQSGVGSLTAFVDDTLAGKPHNAIATNVATRTGMEQLRWAAVTLWTEGAAVNLERLGIEPRKTARNLMKLELGVPLIHLGLPPLEVSSAEPVPATAGAAIGLVAEFEAGMRAMRETHREIARVLTNPVPAGANRTPPPAIPRTPPPLIVEPRPETPAVPTLVAAAAAGDVANGHARVSAAPRPLRQFSEQLTISAALYPELADHCLFPQPPDWPLLADRGPTVPMTMSIMLMRDAAERLQSGRKAIAVEKVLAASWLVAEPPSLCTLTARELDANRIKVNIDSNIDAEFIMADAYPPAPAPETTPLVMEAAPPMEAEAIYEGGWLFHGPAYRGMTRIDAMASDGMRATLKSLPAKGALLDAAGQIIGLWILFSMDKDRLALPVRVQRMQFFGPDPAPGDEVRCRAQVTHIGAREVRGKIELVHNGRLYCRITGWEDWRFHTSSKLYAVIHKPERNLMAEPMDDGVVTVFDPGWPVNTVEFLAGRFLTAEEVYSSRILRRERRQIDWLLGRIAVKDSVRRLLFERGYGPIFPIQLKIQAADSGRPLVSGPFTEDIRISLAHTEGVAVAIAAVGQDVGIDVERIEPRSDQFARMAFTAEEVASLPDGDRNEWWTRLWCAKEAVGKARGTGLQGAPKELQLEAVDGERLLVEGRWVATRRFDQHIVAWTVV